MPITFNNSDLVDALKVSAFGGQASTLAVLPDGRVVVNNASADIQNTHNFFALLERSTRFTEEQLLALQKDFQAGHSGATVFDIDGVPIIWSTNPRISRTGWFWESCPRKW